VWPTRSRAISTRRREVIATLKALGATGARVFGIYLTQVLVLAGLGALPGLAIGAALPFLIAWTFGAVLPLPIAPALHPGELALALLYGLLTAAAFALWPLGRAHDVPVSALFRDEVASDLRWPRRRYIVATVLLGCTLAMLAVELAYDRRIAAMFVAAAAAVFVLLRLVAALIILTARRLPRPRSPIVRLAIANIHRPGALAPSVVLSLGLGLAVLITVIAVDSNLRRQFLAALPDKAPSFLFRRHPGRRCRNVRRLHPRARPARRARTRANAAWTHCGGERRPCRGLEAAPRRDLGAAERSRHHLWRQHPGGLAPG